MIVTLFGDYEGDHLTGSQIREILGNLGIKPEAIRVALHRLKADGWIRAEKQGRGAIYALTPKGRTETAAAAKDVYRTDPKFPQGWQFYLHDDEVEHEQAVAITKEVLAAPIQVSDELGGCFALTSQPQDMPSWIEERLVPHHLLQIANAIVDVGHAVSKSDQALQPLDAKCLRLLLVHQWRRLALRPGTWAHISLLPKGTLAMCHKSMSAFLTLD
ncbi:hypothetical protein [Octadecabacter ascidiaceicola]|uniref:hypothetical protein n=1 Tax=Octadecabacter ascidiaceicola TaxID=1655543 RepID=UPI0015C5BA4F|nr:hypothetical protein [Octadecabacter ascidiaceicola]